MKHLEITGHALPYPNPNEGFRLEADHWPKHGYNGRPLVDGHDPDDLALWLARHELTKDAEAEAVTVTMKVHEGRQMDSPVRYEFTVKAEAPGRAKVKEDAKSHEAARRATYIKEQEEKAANRPRRDRHDRPRNGDKHGW